MTTRRFEYLNDKQITAQVSDENDFFLWIAFAQNSSGNCIIEKEYAFEPDQTFFTLTRTVTKVNQMALDSSNVYVAYEDSTLLGEIISKNNPLTTTTTINIPVGINESPVDVLVDGSDLYFLIPGVISGENAKILRYDTSGSFVETIDLNKSGSIVTNASSFKIDSNNEIAVGTNTDPGNYVRVFALSGGGFDFTIFPIV